MGVQLCFLVHSALWAWGHPWTVTCMRALETCLEVAVSTPPSPTQELSEAGPWLRGSCTLLAHTPPRHASPASS